MYRNQDGIEFLRNLPAQSVDGIFTDPPWDSGPKIIGQDIWKELIQQMAEESLRILKPNGKVLVWNINGQFMWIMFLEDMYLVLNLDLI